MSKQAQASLNNCISQLICVDFNQNITELIPDCIEIPSNPAACYMALQERGPFSVDMCESVQGYPPRLTEAGVGEELFMILGAKMPMWVGLTTTNDE